MYSARVTTLRRAVCLRTRFTGGCAYATPTRCQQARPLECTQRRSGKRTNVSYRRGLGALILPFLADLAFGGWNGVYGIVTVVAIFVPVLFSEFYQPTISQGDRLKYAALGLFAIFLVKFLRQYWLAFASENRRIRVLSGRRAEEASPYQFVIELSVYGSAREEQLLTLFTESSGIPQPIGILRVVDTRHENKVIAIPFSSLEPILKYFEEESRTNSLFALTTVSVGTVDFSRVA